MVFTLGVIAHVDAGKTTFCEQLLYYSHAIRTTGRVDQGTAFMDSHPLEKQRGITIFSSEASFEIDGKAFQLLDTPGHADFSGEMERALSVVDACILIISGAEGIQSHTRTVWHLLKRKEIPTLIFINKTDRIQDHGDLLLDKLQKEFSSTITDFRYWHDNSTWLEEVAEKRDDFLEAYLNGDFNNTCAEKALSSLFFQRQIIPVVSGSALNGVGIDEAASLINVLFSNDQHTPESSDELRAIVYKIKHHAQYGRLAYLRIQSGKIVPRQSVGEEKVTNLYAIQGDKLIPINQATVGMICVVSGLSLISGQVIGSNGKTSEIVTEPMLETDISSTDGTSSIKLLQVLRILEDEEPLLNVQWQEKTQRIKVRIMGTVQLEIMKAVIAERFHIAVAFGKCKVIYMETPAEACMGVGHYEPLRHYAEVRLSVKPGDRGSGIQFSSQCHVDFLAEVWQKQIKEILLKEDHYGVLTGSVLTDAVFVLLNGRAHPKHTEGGDFYEASRRAVRNALMRGKTRLLEPYCKFTVAAPKEYAGALQEKSRVLFAKELKMTYAPDFQMNGECPVATFLEFMMFLPSITHGNGVGWWEQSGYQYCHNEDEVIYQSNYSPLSDLDNPCSSIFCAKGAGFTVEWDHVEEWAHTAPEAHY